MVELLDPYQNQYQVNPNNISINIIYKNPDYFEEKRQPKKLVTTFELL